MVNNLSFLINYLEASLRGIQRKNILIHFDVERPGIKPSMRDLKHFNELNELQIRNRF